MYASLFYVRLSSLDSLPESTGLCIFGINKSDVGRISVLPTAFSISRSSSDLSRHEESVRQKDLFSY